MFGIEPVIFGEKQIVAAVIVRGESVGYINGHPAFHADSFIGGGAAAVVGADDELRIVGAGIRVSMLWALKIGSISIAKIPVPGNGRTGGAIIKGDHGGRKIWRRRIMGEARNGNGKYVYVVGLRKRFGTIVCIGEGEGYIVSSRNGVTVLGRIGGTGSGVVPEIP